MSIGAINEGKKNKTLQALTAERTAIEAMQEALKTDQGASRLLRLLENTMDSAATAVERGTQVVGKTTDAAFEYNILQELGIQPAKGSITSNNVSKALLGYLKSSEQQATEVTPQGQIGREPITIDVESRIIEETVGEQVLALPQPQVVTLENHYNLKRDDPTFLQRVKEDVVTFATKGADAVSSAIRDVIKAIHSGVLATAMIFNPTGMTNPEAFIIVPKSETVVTTVQKKATLPAEVQGMSEAGKTAYESLAPAIQGKNGDKMFLIADKPSGRIFVFDSKGKLVVQKKTLYGAAKGDLYVGNNDLPKNRITPAGLFGLEIVDAAKGGSAKVTAGEYDFGKVFAFKDPDAVVTIMHSVWLKEKDANKRSAALKNNNPADSRYSFGCINVDKETYKFLLDNYEKQMDGSKIFIVPDNQNAVKDFISGNVPDDRLVREKAEPATETIVSTTQSATKTSDAERKFAMKEEEFADLASRIVGSNLIIKCNL
jgi:hypothetical protein